MRTSVVLLDDCGNAIDDFYADFRVARTTVEGDDGNSLVISRRLMVGGACTTSSEIELKDFLQEVKLPFDVRAHDRVFLNADCVYDVGLLAEIERHAGGVQRIPVKFVRVLPPQIDGLDFAVTGQMRDQFANGSPVWCRSARSCKSIAGKDGQSVVTNALRDAIRGWTVIAELTTRHAFRRARREMTLHWEKAGKVTESAENLLSCALGFYPEGERIYEVGRDETRSIRRLELEPFSFGAAKRRARRHQFAPQNNGAMDRRDYLFADNPETISRQIARDVAAFEMFDPEGPFDALALAAWTASILISLRIAYTTMLDVDKKRLAAHRAIRAADTPANLQYVADQFTFMPYLGVRALGERGELRRIRFTDLMGPMDGVLIAFLADVEPRLINTEFCSFDQKTQDALFGMARWFGALYRQRRALMTIFHAHTYLDLLEAARGPNDGAAPDEDARELRTCLRTISSFLTPAGLARLEAGARATVADGLPRNAYALVGPDEHDQAENRPAAALNDILARFGQRAGDTVVDAVSLPIMARAGFLLIPGDYADHWCGQHFDLLDDF